MSGTELEARRSQRLHTAASFRSARTPLQIIDVVEAAATGADAGIQMVRKEQPPRPPSACEEGCAWCCYKLVGMAAPEVLRIVAALRERLSAEEWETLRKRVALGHEERRKLTLVQRRRSALPCPLLHENRCTAYAVRPLTCRGYNSSNARRCEQSLEKGNQVEVPVYLPQQRLATFVLDGMRAGLAENKLDDTLLELTAALHLCFQNADIEQRWLAGEAVFKSAAMP